MLPLLRSEVFRLVRRRMPKALLAILAAVLAGLYFILWASLGAIEEQDPGGAGDVREMLVLSEVPESLISLGFQMTAIVVVILAASVIATEYAWGTIRTILPRSAGRVTFLAAKVVVLAGFAFVAALVALVALLLASAAVTAAEGLDFELGGDFWLDSLQSLGLVTFGALLYIAVAFTVAVLARSTAAGIGVALALLLLETQLVLLISGAGEAGEWIAQVSPGLNLAASFGTELGIEGVEIGAWRGAAVVVAYIVVLLGVAFLQFSRRDITVGGQS